MSVRVGATDDEVMVEEMLELKLDDVVAIELELESSSEDEEMLELKLDDVVAIKLELESGSELVLEARAEESARVELVRSEELMLLEVAN